jgi:HK97 family phage portal protein
VKFRQRIRLAFKAMSMTFPSSMRTLGMLLLPSTQYDYERAVGDGKGSSIVMACALWLARTFPEAPARVRTTNAEGLTTVTPNHRLQRLLERPNPFYSGVVLWMATLIDFLICGNAYWVKIRNLYGDVIQLWYIPQTMICPASSDKQPNVYVTHYEYKPDPAMTQPIKYAVEDIVHFRFGIDEHDVRKGLSPIASLLREIFTDNEAANFSASLLRNLGVPGVILSPGGDEAEAGEDDLDEVKETFKRSFNGDSRGEPMVMRTKTDVKVLSFSPQQMDLKSLRRLPEERVTAVIGLAAVVVGFGAGLDRSTFGNFGEAREAAFEQFVNPHYRMLAADLTLQLLPDFEPSLALPIRDGGDLIEVFFDTSELMALQEFKSRKSKYLTEQFENGVIDRYEARIDLGRQATDADRVYRISTNVIEVPSKDGAVPYMDDLLGAGGGFGDDGGGTAKPKPAGGRKPAAKTAE